jgi:hypothetical protein
MPRTENLASRVHHEAVARITAMAEARPESDRIWRSLVLVGIAAGDKRLGDALVARRLVARPPSPSEPLRPELAGATAAGLRAAIVEASIGSVRTLDELAPVAALWDLDLSAIARDLGRRATRRAASSRRATPPRSRNSARAARQ